MTQIKKSRSKAICHEGDEEHEGKDQKRNTNDALTLQRLLLKLQLMRYRIKLSVD
jgi:hypothetical protein